MKTKSFLLLFVLLSTLSCKKDNNTDNNPGPTNYFSIDATKYTLAKGYRVAGRVYLMSDSLSVTGFEQATQNPIYMGTGDLIGITATGQDSVMTGSYDLSEVSGNLFINYNPALSSFDYHQILNDVSGSCSITLDGLSLKLDITGTLNDGKSLVVKFNGTLAEIN